MADVRALLRQQRAARRVDHPHAAYTDTGKLLCAVCREPVRNESLWDAHLRSAGHRQQLQKLSQSSAPNGAARHAGFVDNGDDNDDDNDNDAQGTSHKRKHSTSDEDMANDGAPGSSSAAVPRKRTKPDDFPLSADEAGPSTATPSRKPESSQPAKPVTPPLRRVAGTPTVGVEMQIPSRPATPGPAGAPKPAAARSHPRLRRAARAPAAPPTAASTDAVISGPVLSAAELEAQAKSEEEARTRRRERAAAQIEDEREEAARALEAEFEVMEELEARARRLREKREALRAAALSAKAGGGTADGGAKGGGGDGGGGGGGGRAGGGARDGNADAKEEGDDDEEDDEDEDEDDWAGFRFRG
ncbi:hypothetical protein VTJ83DRAFT_7056 [Remersonia thermophila]|uniref:Coiled-coil domain-containing protein 16 n=1 Tax=Remersonia thermophila TaxID=72144 RepID=A0ABR4D3X4_9PEZI